MAKSKRTVFDTTVTELEHRKGVWQWQAGDFMWQFDSTVLRGLNVAVAKIKQGHELEWQDAIFCAKMEHAVMYSHGFNAGQQYGSRLERSTSPKTDKPVV